MEKNTTVPPSGVARIAPFAAGDVDADHVTSASSHTAAAGHGVLRASATTTLSADSGGLQCPRLGWDGYHARGAPRTRSTSRCQRKRAALASSPENQHRGMQTASDVRPHHTVAQGRRAAHIQRGHRQRCGQIVRKNGCDGASEQNGVTGRRDLLAAPVPGAQVVAHDQGRQGQRDERRNALSDLQAERRPRTTNSSTTPDEHPAAPVTDWSSSGARR